MLINELFDGHHFDIVVNHAAQAGVRCSIENADAYIQSNMIGFYNILNACRYNLAQHLVHASYSSVYGGSKKVPFSTEDRVDNPEWLSRQYKQSPIWKTAAEYDALFKNNKGALNKSKIEAKLEDMGLVKGQDYDVLEADCKHFAFLDGEVWICINNTLVDINNIIPKSVENAVRMFYVYLANNKFEQKDEIVRQIQGIV